MWGYARTKSVTQNEIKNYFILTRVPGLIQFLFVNTLHEMQWPIIVDLGSQLCGLLELPWEWPNPLQIAHVMGKNTTNGIWTHRLHSGISKAASNSSVVTWPLPSSSRTWKILLGSKMLEHTSFDIALGGLQARVFKSFMFFFSSMRISKSFSASFSFTIIWALSPAAPQIQYECKWGSQALSSNVVICGNRILLTPCLAQGPLIQGTNNRGHQVQDYIGCNGHK